MTLRGCPREKELTTLMLRGQWPGGSDKDLRDHVEGCRSCSEVALVMQAFRAARARSAEGAAPAPPGVIWWRAQLRKRNAALKKLSRPILGAQIFALAVALVIAIALAASQARYGLAWLAELSRGLAAHFTGMWPEIQSGSLPGLMLLACGLAAVVVMSGVVLYLDRQRQ